MLRKSWMQMIFIANVYQVCITWFLLLVSFTNMGSKMPILVIQSFPCDSFKNGMLFVFMCTSSNSKGAISYTRSQNPQTCCWYSTKRTQGRRNLFGYPATLMCTCYVIHTTWLGPTWQLYRKLISWLGLLFALPYRKFTISGLPSSRLRYGWNEIWYWCRSALAHKT